MIVPFNKLFTAKMPTNFLWSIGYEKFCGQENESPDFIISKQTVNNLEKYDLVIADYSSEHWGSVPGVIPAYNELLETNLNFIFLTHNEPDHLLKSNYLFFPHWYFSRNLVIKPQYDSVNKLNKQFKMSCLNAGPRVHRVYNFLKLRKKSYFNDMLFTFHNSEPTFRHDDPVLDDDYIHEWECIRKTLPHYDSILMFPWTGANAHPAYTESYIHLITETTIIPKIFITEKTWKTIASGVLFILLGNPGSVQHLRNLGVDTFDDYIDHDYYDTETDWKKRIDKIHELVDYFMYLDESKLEQINKETYNRRLENIKKYFAGEFISKYIKYFENKVNELSIR